MKLYKVLIRNDGRLVSPFQGYEYEPYKEYVCADFNPNPKEDCSYGYYATGIEGIIYSFRNLPYDEVWEVEVGGRSVEIDQFKRRYERIKLIRQVPLEEVKALAKAEEKRVGYKLAEALFPINPFLLNAKTVTKKEIELVKKWNSIWSPINDAVWDSIWSIVWKSIRDSAWSSVWNPVWSSVRNSVWNSISDSVRNSVWDSVWNPILVYTSSLFPNIKKWKYIKHPEGKNPFQPCIDLWRQGLVPSFDGKVWRIYAGKKAEVVWEGKLSHDD